MLLYVAVYVTRALEFSRSNKLPCFSNALRFVRQISDWFLRGAKRDWLCQLQYPQEAGFALCANANTPVSKIKLQSTLLRKVVHHLLPPLRFFQRSSKFHFNVFKVPNNGIKIWAASTNTADNTIELDTKDIVDVLKVFVRTIAH